MNTIEKRSTPWPGRIDVQQRGRSDAEADLVQLPGVDDRRGSSKS